jgi:hypothetical protein
MMQTWKLRKFNLASLSLLGLLLLGAAFLCRPRTAVLAQAPAVAFTVRSYGGKCLEFGAVSTRPIGGMFGSAPVFIADCNGAAAQQVHIEELADREGHLVILRAGNGVIGAKQDVVLTQQTFAAAQAEDSSASFTTLTAGIADQTLLEVQAYSGSDRQIFALDGDSIILAAERNLVVEVQRNRGANGTPLVLGRRDLDDSEFWTFTATNGSGLRPTSGFVRISQTDNSADGELRARADFLHAIFSAKWGTVIELEPNVSLNLADTPPLHIPAGVTIRGDRRGTRPGPLLAALNQARPQRSPDYPYFEGGTLFIHGTQVRITGLRLQGPSRSITEEVPKANGIATQDQFISIIDHNEMFDWTGAAVYVHSENASDPGDPRSSRPRNVRVVRNFFHHNHRWGGGYGVVSYDSYPDIEGNTFLSNRHAIAASSYMFTAYRARFNLVLSAAPDYSSLGYNHTSDFDLHGTFHDGCEHCGGPAGQYVEIASNTFLGTNRENFGLRGTPSILAKFHHNVLLGQAWFALKNLGDPDKFIVSNNQFGVANPTNRLGVGDFDGDGKDDLFLATGAAWYYAPAGQAEWRYLNAQTDKINTLLFGDFDADGRTDVFTQHGGSKWDVSWGGATRWETINGSGPLLGKSAIGDFNGDGRADVFYADGAEWLVSYSGTGYFTHLASAAHRVTDLRFGDFNNDGKTDVFGVLDSNWVAVFGGTSYWMPLRTKLTTGVADLIVADFNGDGHDDIARVSLNPLTLYTLQVSFGGTGNWTTLRSGLGTIAAIGRFDDAPGADALTWAAGNVLNIASAGTGNSVRYSRQDMR